MGAAGAAKRGRILRYGRKAGRTAPPPASAPGQRLGQTNWTAGRPARGARPVDCLALGPQVRAGAPQRSPRRAGQELPPSWRHRRAGQNRGAPTPQRRRAALQKRAPGQLQPRRGERRAPRTEQGPGSELRAAAAILAGQSVGGHHDGALHVVHGGGRAGVKGGAGFQMARGPDPGGGPSIGASPAAVKNNFPRGGGFQTRETAAMRGRKRGRPCELERCPCRNWLERCPCRDCFPRVPPRWVEARIAAAHVCLKGRHPDADLRASFYYFEPAQATHERPAHRRRRSPQRPPAAPDAYVLASCVCRRTPGDRSCTHSQFSQIARPAAGCRPASRAKGWFVAVQRTHRLTVARAAPGHRNARTPARNT